MSPRRGAVLALKVLAAGVALIGCLLTTAYVWLTTAGGEAWLKGALLRAINDDIRGHLSIDRLHVHDLQLDLEGIVLRAPSGEVVARVRRLARIEILPLSLRKIALYSARASGAVIEADVEPGTRIPLLVAIDPRHPETAGSRLAVRHVSFGDATLIVRQRIAPQIAPRLDMTGLEGAYDARGTGAGLKATVDLAGAVRAPMTGPTRIAVTLERSDDEPLVVRADVIAPGLAFKGEGAFPSGTHAFHVDRLELQPVTARALWPGYPMLAPVTLTGNVEAHPGLWDVDGVLLGPAGHVSFRGAVAPPTLTVASMRLEMANLDVRAWLGRGPATSLTGTVRLVDARLARPWPIGALDVAGSGLVAGQQVERLSLTARSGPEGVDVRDLRAAVPGGSVALSGVLQHGTVTATGSATATDLASVSKVVAALTGTDVALRGEGNAYFQVRGPVANPAVVLDAWFPDLASGPTSVRGLRANLAVSGLHEPLARSSFRLAATSLAVGGRTFDRAALTARAAGGRTSIDAFEAGRLVLHGAASIVPERFAARIDTLWSRIGASWEMAGPATLTFRNGTLRVTAFELRSGRQRIAMSGTVGPQRVRARLTLRTLDLATLATSVPGSPSLAGSLSGVLAVSGPRADPAVAVRATIVGGPVPRLRRAVTRIEARRTPRGAVAGVASLSSPGARASVRVVSGDMLLRAPLTTPLVARVTVNGGIGDVLSLAGLHAPLRGHVDGRATVRGSFRSPRIDSAVSARIAGARPVPPATVRTTVRIDGAGTLVGVRFASLGATGRVRGSTPLTLPQLVAGIRDDRLMDAPWHASVTVRGLRAAPVAALFKAVPTLRGTLFMHARAHGPARDPAVDLAADVERFSFRGATAARAHLGVVRRPGFWQAGGTIDQRGGKASFAATLWQRGGVAEWGRNFGEARGAIDGALECHDVDVAAFAPLLPRIRSASGRLSGTVHALGALKRPALTGDVSWRGGALATNGIGEYRDLDLAARVDERGFAVDVRSLRSAGGSLSATVEGVRGPHGTAAHGSAVLRDFPVVAGWRERARVDAHLAIDGNVEEHRARAKVVVTEAAVRLPASLGPQVQDPAPSRDVRLVSEVPPIERWSRLPRPSRPAAPAIGDAPPDPTVAIEVDTPRPVAVRGPGVEVEATLANFRIVRDGVWLVFGSVHIPVGDLNVLGTRVALLSRSEIRFAGPPTVPFMAIGARGSFGGRRSILVARGLPGDVQLGFAPSTVNESQVFASMASSGGEGTPLGGPPAMPQTTTSLPLALIGSRMPLGVLLGLGPPASSFEVGAPVTGRLRLVTSDRIGADPLEGENAHTLRLELRLAPSLHAEVSFGDAQTGAANVVWVLRR